MSRASPLAVAGTVICSTFYPGSRPEATGCPTDAWTQPQPTGSGRYFHTKSGPGLGPGGVSAAGTVGANEAGWASVYCGAKTHVGVGQRPLLHCWSCPKAADASTRAAPMVNGKH